MASEEGEGEGFSNTFHREQQWFTFTSTLLGQRGRDTTRGPRGGPTRGLVPHYCTAGQLACFVGKPSRILSRCVHSTCEESYPGSCDFALERFYCVHHSMSTGQDGAIRGTTRAVCMTRFKPHAESEANRVTVSAVSPPSSYRVCTGRDVRCQHR